MKNPIYSMILPSIVAAALGAACGGGNDQTAKAPESTPAPASTEATSAAPASPSETAGASSGSPGSADSSAPSSASAAPASDSTPTESSPSLSDDQIIQVTHVANLGEIEQAKLAQSKAKDGRVKKLATMMMKDHKDADTKGMSLAKKANLSPTSSPTSTSLEGDAESATSTLKSQSGADFDKGYVDAQVKEHQAVLDAIDQKLLPNAKNANVKAFLTEVRPKIAMHLQHAKDLQKQMAK